MTQIHLIEASLPLYIQCLRVPAEWRVGAVRKYPSIRLGGKRTIGPLSSLVGVKSSTVQQDSDVLSVRQIPGSVTAYDPWEKRAEFFRLKRNNMEGLLGFLRSVGLFEPATSLHALAREPEFEDDAIVRADDGLPYRVRYLSKVSATTVWELRRLVEGSLRKQSGTGGYADFQVRIVRIKGQPRVILTTTTFMEALLLTLSVDRALGAKVRKCARPDCGVMFSNTSAHKRKYCQWYCGHIESVRKQRRKAKQKGGRSKGSRKKSTRG